MLRRFSCPDCGALLDTEIALADDPFLDDILL
jgi:acetone carboxylase gamma subunit